MRSVASSKLRLSAGSGEFPERKGGFGGNFLLSEYFLDYFQLDWLKLKKRKRFVPRENRWLMKIIQDDRLGIDMWLCVKMKHTIMLNGISVSRSVLTGSYSAISTFERLEGVWGLVSFGLLLSRAC